VLLATASEPAAPQPDERSHEANDPTVPLSHSPRDITILYVEDNLVNITLVERTLARRPGATVIPVMQGRLALELARQHKPDVILLDLHLPDCDGTTVLEALGDDPVLAEIPVVIVSADASPQRINDLLQSHAKAYLTKPIDVHELLATIGRLVDHPGTPS
jgi:CheY-like chemotaxis protein